MAGYGKAAYGGGYDDRQSQAEIMRAKRSIARDIVVPPCANPRRRARCKANPALFAKTYFPHLCYLPLSPMHVEIIDRIKRLMLGGGRQAIAAPRGHGKDTLIMILILWAVLYGHLKFLVLICANNPEAVTRLEAIKYEIESNELLQLDFPEVCEPAIALEGATQRGRMQTVNGLRTDIDWGSDQIRFPRVKVQGKNGVPEDSPASGTYILALGIEGGLRGLNRRGKRVDFFMVSDAESEESVESEAISGKLERRIDNALGGVGGPGKNLSGVMLCTIMKKGCLADRYTNPRDKSSWRGVRYRAIVKMPERVDLWEEYRELRKRGMESGEDETGRKAHAFYLANRKAMDDGAEVVWTHRFVPDLLPDGSQQEVSALQSYMNIWADSGESMLLCEYQNDPPDENKDTTELTAEVVRSRLNGLPPLRVPDGCKAVVQGIDIQKEELWYTVVALMEDGTGRVIDHDRQRYDVLTSGDSVGLKDPVLGRILAGLRSRRDEIEGGMYRDLADNPVQVGMSVIDTGGQKGWERVVYAFCREAGPRWRAVKGSVPFRMPKPRKDVILGRGWFAAFQPEHGTYLYMLDSDEWKHYVHDGFRQAVDSPGSLSLYGASTRDHIRYSQHIVAERYSAEKGRWVQEAKSNHLLDCTYMAMAAGGMLKIRRMMAELMPSVPVKAPQPAAKTGSVGWVKKRGGWLGR